MSQPSDSYKLSKFTNWSYQFLQLCLQYP